MINAKTRFLAAIAGIGLLLPAAGCGGGDDTGDAAAPEVASVASTAPPAGAKAPSGPSAATRPLLRRDMSQEESERLYAAWGQCLTDQGVPAPPPGKANPASDVLDQPQHAAAVAACLAKEPESEWDHLKRTDPEYSKKFRDFIQCMRDQGISVEPVGDGPGFRTTDDRQVERGMTVVSDCDDKAFR